MSIAGTYPARVDARLDPPLSRWLWLVKWVLVIPHYIVVGIFLGGGTWAATHAGWPGLVPVLAVIAALIVMVTGRYPRGVYDFILGMNRWALRVAAYAGLMTDKYPPFRLDLGGREPERADGE